jgi:hypothetical protein
VPQRIPRRGPWAVRTHGETRREEGEAMNHGADAGGYGRAASWRHRGQCAVPFSWPINLANLAMLAKSFGGSGCGSRWRATWGGGAVGG